MKKYENLFQIGEVAALLGISRKMILNYEAYRLIKPALVDDQTGYRYFDPFTIARLQLILDLRKTGMTMTEVGKYLKGTLSAKKQIDKLKQQILSAQKAIEQLEMRDKEASSHPVIKEISLPVRHCIGREVVAKDIEDAISTVVSVYRECIERKLKFSVENNHFCEFLKNVFEEDFYELTDISMRVCICVDETALLPDAVVYPATKALTVSYCGEYDKGLAYYELIKQYIADNGYTVNGFPQENYLEGNFDNLSDKNIVQIVVPVI